MANEQNNQTQNTSFKDTDLNTENQSSTGITGTTGTTGTSGTAGSTSTIGGGTSGSTSGTSGLTAESAKETARGLIDQAKGTAGQAFGAATQRATEVLDEKKVGLASGLTGVADAVRQVGETLRSSDEETGIPVKAAEYSDTLAQQIEKISGYFERNDVRTMVRDVEGYARRNPALFIGAAFGLGLLAARFLKSSPSNVGTRRSYETDRDFNRGGSSFDNADRLLEDDRTTGGTPDLSPTTNTY
jgi:hypothetical protein